MEKHSTSLIAKRVGNFLKQFHLLIFFIFTVGCLAVAVVLVNQILTESPSDESYTSTIGTGTIDKNTLNHIQSLHTSTTAPTPEVPQGRINPFAE